MLTQRHLEYIEGRKFGSNFRFDPRLEREYLSRDEAILKTIKDKKVVHLGFAGHFENIDQSMRQGKWFHQKLYDHASLCVGVDIDERAVNYIAGNFDYEHLYCVDILEESLPVLLENQFDYIVLGEVLEHIDNPVDFIARLGEKYGRNIEGIILTVPNAFRRKNFYNTLKGVEKINSDHRYWFTPYTIAKVLHRGGCIVDKISLCSGRDRSRLNLMERIQRFFSLESFFPLFRDTLVVFARLQ